VGIDLARDQSPGDQPVDHRRDRGRLDGESLGERRGHGGTVDEMGQEPVLGERQVQRRDGHLDQLGQTGDGAPRAEAEVLGGVGLRGKRASDHHGR
jgi:hypothetical protein